MKIVHAPDAPALAEWFDRVMTHEQKLFLRRWTLHLDRMGRSFFTDEEFVAYDAGQEPPSVLEDLAAAAAEREAAEQVSPPG